MRIGNGAFVWGLAPLYTPKHDLEKEQKERDKKWTLKSPLSSHSHPFTLWLPPPPSPSFINSPSSLSTAHSSLLPRSSPPRGLIHRPVWLRPLSLLMLSPVSTLLFHPLFHHPFQSLKSPLALPFGSAPLGQFLVILSPAVPPRFNPTGPIDSPLACPLIPFQKDPLHTDEFNLPES